MKILLAGVAMVFLLLAGAVAGVSMADDATGPRHQEPVWVDDPEPSLEPGRTLAPRENSRGSDRDDDDGQDDDSGKVTVVVPTPRPVPADDDDDAYERDDDLDDRDDDDGGDD